MANAVNTQHALGVDRSGAAGGPLFSGTTAATLQVAITDPLKLASADPAKGGLDNTNAHRARPTWTWAATPTGTW